MSFSYLNQTAIANKTIRRNKNELQRSSWNEKLYTHCNRLSDWALQFLFCTKTTHNNVPKNSVDSLYPSIPLSCSLAARFSAKSLKTMDGFSKFAWFIVLLVQFFAKYWQFFRKKVIMLKRQNLNSNQ